MQAENDLQQWLHLVNKLAEKYTAAPRIEWVLLLIGVLESGIPLKKFTEYENVNLVQMAVCSILGPARYYELFWVDDSCLAAL